MSYTFTNHHKKSFNLEQKKNIIEKKIMKPVHLFTHISKQTIGSDVFPYSLISKSHKGFEEEQSYQIFFGRRNHPTFLMMVNYLYTKNTSLCFFVN